MANEVAFTPAQNDAIATRGKTLLVSAGAGSGKTTVLTRRIIESIKRGTDINDLLVVTFTNAAAASLKDKLYSSLLAESAENPSNRRLIHTIYNIPSAKISTIHSFCLDLIRNNFARLSLPPSMRVADKAESGILLETCLEDLTDESFESGDESFITLCDAFAGEKSLDGFKETVHAVYNRYLAFPFWKRYIGDAVERETVRVRLAEEHGFMNTAAGREIAALMRERISMFRGVANAFYERLTACAYKENHLRALDGISDYLCGLEAVFRKENAGYNAIKEFLNTLEIPNAYTTGLPEDVADGYKKLKAVIIKEIKSWQSCFSPTEKEAINDYGRVLELNTLMNGFIIRLDDKYASAKKARGILDFADLEQFTLELLGEHTPGGVVRSELCGEIRKGFAEIYIDEYQDINPLQDMIFRLLSKENNRFMVGDVKQSIYRFRNAKADIFLGYLKSFPTLDKNESEAKIFLPENHRSKKPILDFVNLLFDSLYTEENMNASYKEERLVYPDKPVGEPFPVCVNIFGEGEDPAADEAEYVADMICRLVNAGEGGKKYNYGDMALILRSVATSAVEYERAFTKRGIPYSVAKSGDFLTEPEVLLALSVLRVMDNPLDDISLAAAMRSPVFCFTADDLYAVKRYYARESLYDCVVKCGADYKRFLNKGKKYKTSVDFRRIKRIAHPFIVSGTAAGERPDTVVRKKCHDFLTKLEKLRRSGTEAPTNRLIWEMYMKTSLVSLCAADENGKKKKQNLYTLYQYALDFERSSFKGLSSFLSYIGDIADSYGADLASDSGDKNRVKIMSVHKSKGMEFPVCFVSSLGRKFNNTDISAKYIVRDDGFVFYNLRRNNGLSEYMPLVKKAAAYEEKKALYREELRCLYVALTRARERLFVTGRVKNVGDDYGTEGKGFFESGCFMDWIYPILNTSPKLCFTLRREAIISENRGNSETAEKTELIPDSVFADALNFVYPYGGGYRVPAKAAVSELRKGILEDGEYTRSIARGEAGKIPCFMPKQRDYSSVGTATHLFMQFADFENVDKKGVAAEIERLVGIKMITPEEGTLIDVKSAEEFFKSPLKKQISESPAVYREKRFNLIEKSSLVSDKDGESVMIQGVIDCFFQNPDGTYTVVDYKTDRLPREGGEEILISRHSLQIKYYCRAAEKITGKRVNGAYLYSFSLGKAIEVDYEG
ncbi:MAG: UvrD-helicase domain-containing protein [Eubacteriales bacterium]|nr:UvrD-helicase domain-containing protein [Eubacteriales bacterium]